jgi:aminodeoxyfutalosine synthase
VAEDQQGVEAVTPRQILEAPDLIAAGMAGDEVRRRMHGTRTTFVRVLEVHVDAPPTALPPGCHAGEIRVVGAPRSLDAAVAAVRAAAALAGDVPVTGFSVADLAALGPLAETVRTLSGAGLAAIAQLPIDAVADPELAVQEIRQGGLSINAITVNQLDDDARLEICERANRLQASGAGVKAFAPLARTMSITKPTTGYDDVKMVSLARVVVTSVPSIQVDWQLYGPKLAQVVLTVGADDVDNISAVDPGVLGTRRSPLEEIRGNIRAAGLDAVERTGLFRVNSQTPTPDPQDN